MAIIEAAAVHLDELKAGNQRFVQQQPKTKRNKILSPGERVNISAVILSCSDARVPPEIIFDQEINTLFTIRVAGNVADRPQIESVEFATHTWDVPLVVVLGHTDCRAVVASIDLIRAKPSQPPEFLSHTLENIALGIESVIAKAAASKNTQALLTEATESHVNVTIATLIKRSKILATRVSSSQTCVLGGLYHVESGLVRFWETQ